MRIVEQWRSGGGAAVLEAPAGVAIAEPFFITIPTLERRETFVQIIDPG